MRDKILIVDDEADIVSMLKDYFEFNGYDTITAVNGLEAIQKAEKQPDIILLDINMPDIDGMEVCMRIRDFVSCPILFLTARIEDGDKILVSEGCTHHRQCDDIGSVKLPRWIRQYTGKEPEFVFSSGTEFPADLSPYKMIVHCGGCMLNEREMKYRLACAKDQNIPMTNYGILIAYIQGILKRSVEPFPAVSMMLTEEPS